MRNVISLNGSWVFKKTNEIPEALPDTWEKVTLPHTWNAVDGQDGGNDYFRGTGCYVRSLHRPDLAGNRRAVLEVNGAAMISEVFVNGTKLCHHEGGYSTFRVDITDALQDQNLLVITCDNSDNDHCYPQKADFTFYGGLYRDVNLILVPEEHFALLENGTPGVHVDTIVSPDGSAKVHVQAWTSATEGEKVTFCVRELGVKKDGAFAGARDSAADGSAVVDENGYAEAVLTVEHAHLWDGLRDPFLYAVTANLSSGDAVSVHFGIRTIDVDPEKGFLLNGRVYPLRGVSRHQDRQGAGNAISQKMQEEDLSLILEMGANAIRLAHYEQAEEFYDICDEAGVIVWNEIPFISCFMQNGRENTISQLKELITQRYNHPSVICWGLSNEITADGNTGDALQENLKALNDVAHRLDPTRPTTMAHVFMLETTSPITRIADINAYNLYFGWYLGELSENDEFFDKYHQEYPDRAIGFSEYGADANPKIHSAHPKAGDYSEEYQCLYHEHLIQMIEERPYLWSTFVWNMFDFAADGRDEGGAHGLNQKGLVSFDRKTKKDAFYAYKAAWNTTDPFVHICGRRFVNRDGESTEIRVYSNERKVTLFVNGKEAQTKEGSRVFVFTLPMKTGETYTITASGEEGQEDTIKIHAVEQPDPSYVLVQTGAVNWLDTMNLNRDYYSLEDTLGEVSANPEAGALVGALMQKAVASRGDVAKSAGNNEALQRMMAYMKVVDMFQKSGVVSKEEMQELNEKLQTIRKA